MSTRLARPAMGRAVLLAAAAVTLFFPTPPRARALNGTAHTRVTAQAIELLRKIDRKAVDRLGALRGQCAEIRGIRKRNAAFAALSRVEQLEIEAREVDNYNDLEFVDVEGVGAGRDNPHKKEWNAINDKAHYGDEGTSLTAFNHFIDIRKGHGVIDDFDGYAFRNGSGCRDEHESAKDAAPNMAAKIMGGLSGFKVDSGLVGYWYNDEYVHAYDYGYKGCSPSVYRYSFPGDQKRFRSSADEAKARFPPANSTGAKGRGIPYSIFMPVDNMARYWYGRFASNRDLLTLAPVLHAAQDASVPHHAAGCLGNWHGRYEKELETKALSWIREKSMVAEARELVEVWSIRDYNPPARLETSDRDRRPSISWPVEHLVTWMALNSYREYDGTYNHFRAGYCFDETSARKLTRYALAMTALILRKAAAE